MRLFITAFTLTILLVSCCGLPVFPLTINYQELPNLNELENEYEYGEIEVTKIRVDENYNVLDSIQDYLSDDYTIHLDFVDEVSYGYILCFPSIGRCDTLHNITMKKSRCKIKNVSYEWNGVKMDDKEIVVE